MLNDSGPFDFVLDTAAQVTTIDPALATDLHLKLLGETGVTGAGFSTRAPMRPAGFAAGGRLRSKRLAALDPQSRTDTGQRPSGARYSRRELSWSISTCSSIMPHGIVCLDDTKQMQEKVKGEHIALVPPSHPERNLPFTEPLMVPVRVSGVAGRSAATTRFGNQLAAVVRRWKATPCCVCERAAAQSRHRRSVACLRRSATPGHSGRDCIAYSRFLSSRLLLRARTFQDAEIDGVLPTALFQRVFISYADHFAVLDPW